MENEQQLFLLDLLADIKRSKHNRIIVCLHATAARNTQDKFVSFCRDAGLPVEIVGESAVEVRACDQWQRVYFASAYQHPDHYANRVAQVYLMPGIEGAVQSVSWVNAAKVMNKEWAE